MIPFEEKADAPGVVVRLEMALTPAEFRRLVHLLPGTQPVRVAEMSAICEQANGQRWEITVSNARMRSLASLTLPIADVEIAMNGYADSSVRDFLEQFHLIFHRGGG